MRRFEPTSHLVAIVALITGGCDGCRPGPNGEPPTVPSGQKKAASGPSAVPSVTPAPSAASPLAMPSMLDVDVESFESAVLAAPVGATAPRPVVVALHGNYDRPEWQCDVWRGIAPTWWVLCPRGQRRTDAPKGADRWTFGTLDRTRAELEAGLQALRRRFGAYVAEGPITLAGFSLGAIYGARIAIGDPEQYPRVVLIEGGEAAWSREAISRFRQGGGQRVLLVCAQEVCKQRSQKLGALFGEGDFRLALALGAGHTYGGVVAEKTAANWPWLEHGQERASGAPVQ